MWLIDQLAEARILQAIERGELDNLPGAGRPLALDDDSLVPEELRMAYRVLKNAGCLPPELELRREIQALELGLVHLGGTRERRRALKRLSFLRTRLEVTGQRSINLLAQQEYYEQIVRRLGGVGSSKQICGQE